LDRATTSGVTQSIHAVPPLPPASAARTVGVEVPLTDPHPSSALALAGRIRRRELRAVDVLEDHLLQIRARDPGLGAFVQVLEGPARRRAAAIDKRTASGAPPGSLLGVPFAIKDTDPVRFAWNRAGSRAYRHLWAPFDAPQVRRMRAAGVVIAGKTSTSELALMPVVETDIAPPTRNPWNPAFSAGGSSGGAGAAVAGGLLPVAHAADGAGSIRIPAALCHLFGFKPSRGLTPHFYKAVDKVHLAHVGCVAHTVEDSAAVMDALAGRPDASGPDALLPQVFEAPPAGLRIRMCLEAPTATVDPLIVEGVRGVARALEALGHHVEEIGPFGGTLDEFLPVYQNLAAGAPTLTDASLQPVTRWLRAAGRKVPLSQAQKLQAEFQARALAWFGDADLVLSPTTPCFAPRVGAFDGMEPEAAFRAAADLGAFTAVFNASGQPAASVPMGTGGPDTLPMGAQLVGPPGGDVRVLQVARQLQGALGWVERRAPGVA
jgi:amidase